MTKGVHSSTPSANPHTHQAALPTAAAAAAAAAAHQVWRQERHRVARPGGRGRRCIRGVLLCIRPGSGLGRLPLAGGSSCCLRLLRLRPLAPRQRQGLE